MRSTTLTVLFFALFALFSTVAYAVPVAPQGVVSKRQCSMGVCKDAVPAPPSSGSNIDPAAVFDLIKNLLGLLPPGTQPPAAASASTSTSVPTTQPTGV